jgi:hypothetical protein
MGLMRDIQILVNAVLRSRPAEGGRFPAPDAKIFGGGTS